MTERLSDRHDLLHCKAVHMASAMSHVSARQKAQPNALMLRQKSTE